MLILKAIRLAAEFFFYDSLYGLSFWLRTIYWARLGLLAFPLSAVITLVDVVQSWPIEEAHVTLREFDQFNTAVRSDIHELQALVAEIKAFEMERERAISRIETKVDLFAHVIGAICTLMLVPTVVYLLKFTARRELLRYMTWGPKKEDE